MAYNELLFGCLDGEEGALEEQKAEYDEARAASEGSDSCWSGSESGVEVEAEAVPMILEGAVGAGVAAVQQAEGGEKAGFSFVPPSDHAEQLASQASRTAPYVLTEVLMS